MTRKQGFRRYDLEGRTHRFAKRVRAFVKLLPRTLGNTEDARQSLRSSGSVGANYIEANEAVGKKDFRHRVKISRKEAKEARYWLELVDVGDSAELEKERLSLTNEATQPLKILNAIAIKVE